MARLELGFLGGFRARLSPGDVVALPTRKVQALLAYLAIPPGQAHPRDKLAALLWGDMSQKQARGNLRQALASLRRALGSTEALRLEGDAVILDPAHATSDVGAFDARAAEGSPEALAEAARLYAGDFLAGLTLQEPPFEEWLLAERERLRERAIEILARLLAHQRRSDEREPAVQTALKLLALDPLQEPVHRTLMRLYVLLGRRAAALRQYQLCVAAIERELRAQPEPETKALYQEILRERPAIAPALVETDWSADAAEAARPTAPRPVLKSPDLPSVEIPIVGREAELARLTEILDAVRAGHGHIVEILGDPGVGKSRLAAEAVARAAGCGARVLVGRCFETERQQPFAMWVDALRGGGVLDDPAAVDALSPVWRSELARLFPELGAPTAPARDGADPLHLFEAMSRLVEGLAQPAPLVVLFEDQHWVDEMSLRLLRFLARRIRGWRMLVIGTLREDEIAGDARLRQIADEMDRERLVVRLPLAPLSRTDTSALARQLLPAGSGAPLEEHVWQTSEGNAFMAVETVRALADRATEWQAGALPLPARVRELVAGRLNRLTVRGRRLAAVAGVIGRQFEFALLQRASDLPEEDAAEAVEELVRRRVFRQSGDGFEFAHDRIREVAYASLLPPQRSLLHRRVAESLELLLGADAPDAAGPLAFHFHEAGAWAKAVGHLSRFGEQAARGYAHADAARAFQQALAALAHQPPGPERDRRQLELSLRRAHSLYFTGQWPEAVEILERQSPLLAGTSDPALSGPWHAWLGHLYIRLGEHGRAQAAARRAIDEASRAGDDATSGRAHGVLALESFWSGRAREGVALGARAAALLEPTLERWWLGMSHFYTAMNHILLGGFGAAREALHRMQTVGETILDNRLRSYAAWATGWAAAQEGRSEDATQACRLAQTLATDPVSEAYASAFLGYACLEGGDAASAAERLDRAVGHFGQFHFKTFEAWFLGLLAEARRLEGRSDLAADLARRGEALAREVGFPLAVAWCRRALGRLARAQGAPEEAERALGDALETFRGIEAEFEVGRTLLDLAELARARGDLARARAHGEAARVRFIALEVPGYAARAEQLAAGL